MYPPLAFYISAGSALIYAILMGIILMRGVKKAGNLSVFMFFLATIIWSTGEMWERYVPVDSGKSKIAILGAYTLFIGMALTPAVLMHLGWDYPTRFMPANRKARTWVLYTLYSISLLAIALEFITPKLVIDHMEPYNALGDTVWGLIPGPFYRVYVVYMYIVSIIATVLLFYKTSKEKVTIVRIQGIYVSSGLALALILLTGTGVIPIILGITNIYPLTTPSFIILGFIIIYLTFRYRAFLPEKSMAQSTGGSEGVLYLPKDEAYEKFLSSVAEDVPALAFIPTDRDEFIKKNKLDNAIVFEIAEKNAPDTINPTIDEMRSMIPFIVMSFAEENRGATVLLHYRKAVKKSAGKEALEALEKELESVFSSHKGTFIVVDE